MIDEFLAPPDRSDSSDAAPLHFPPELADYLPDELWARLTGDKPRRGILLNGLDRLRSQLYLISTYLPAHLVQEKMRRPVPGRVNGQLLEGSLLFSDVSGFTALAERLAVIGPEGAERLTTIMNDYFEVMLEILAWSGGVLLKFAGDAALVYFPQQENNQQAQWAVRAGQRMMSRMVDFAAIETPQGQVGLRMKIGVATGPFLSASVGAAERMEYVVLGEAITRTMAAEGSAEAGMIVMDEATARALSTPPPPHQDGFYAIEPQPDEAAGDFEIKAESRRPRGAVPWNATPHAIVAQMEVAGRQIRSLTPYLAPELVRNIVGGGRKRAIDSEYRPATVMFINFTGLEELLAQERNSLRSSQTVTRLLNDYFNGMHRIIAHHGGVLTRIDPYSKGSKMLVLFGAPVAHEDDPYRAASAALAMRAELKTLNADWRRLLRRQRASDDDQPIVTHRIGITQGLTFAGEVGAPTRREYTVMGDDVNLAARLMGASQMGQILVSQKVYEEIKEQLAANRLDPIRVKGKSQPIPIFEVASRRADSFLSRLHGRDRLIGRERETAQGRAALRQAFLGQGRVLLLAGAPGIGKSHLADLLAGYHHQQGGRIHFAQCNSFTAGAAYAPWITLLRSLSGMSAADDAAHCRHKLQQFLAQLDLDKPEYQRPLANLLGLRLAPESRPAPSVQSKPAADAAAPAGRQSQGPSLFSRLEKKVAASPAPQQSAGLWQLAASRQPAASGQLYQRVQGQIASRERERLYRALYGLIWRLAHERPLALYFENSQWMDEPSWRLIERLAGDLAELPVVLLIVQRQEEAGDDQRLSGSQKISLPPLAEAETAELVRHLWPAFPSELIPLVHRQSEGNPLFIEEIVNWAERAGPESPEKLKEGLLASSSVQELVLSHVDSLTPAARDVAKAASIIGAEFSLPALRALLPRLKREAELRQWLDYLQEARLLFTIEQGDESRYLFRQTLVQEVLYNSQPFARRREGHSALADYWRDFLGEEDLARAELLAHHYLLAERWLPAAHYLLHSGHKARERFALPQARAYYEQALRAAGRAEEAGEDGRAKRLLIQAEEALGDTALLSAEYEAAAGHYERAAQRLDSVASDEPALWRSGLRLKLALALAAGDQMGTAIDHAAAVWQANQPDHRPAAAATLAWLHWRQDGPETARWLEEARRLNRAGNDSWTAGAAALLLELAGQWEAARQAYKEMERPALAALAAGRQAVAAMKAGHGDKAQRLLDEAVHLHEDGRDGGGLALARYLQAEYHRRQEELPAARAALQIARDLLAKEEAPAAPSAAQLDDALQRLDSRPDDPLSLQPWQSYQDSLHISLLFRLTL